MERGIYTDTAQQSKGWNRDKPWKLCSIERTPPPSPMRVQCSVVPVGDARDRLMKPTGIMHGELLGWQLVGNLGRWFHRAGDIM